jgi:hypothetical protein
MFGSMDDWIISQRRRQQQREFAPYSPDRVMKTVSSQTIKPRPASSPADQSVDEEDEDEFEEMVTDPSPSSAAAISSPAAPKQHSEKVKMWPPWPFNLLQRPAKTTSDGTAIVSSPRSKGGPAVRLGGFAVAFFRQQTLVSLKQMQDVGSRLWFHLPPSIPPLILFTLLPRQEQQLVLNAETGLETMATKTVMPLWSNPVARSLVLGGISLAIMSWAHSELNRLRKLEPLPLNEAYRDIHKAVLPHFLPEEGPEPFLIEDDQEDSSSSTSSSSSLKDDALASEAEQEDEGLSASQGLSNSNAPPQEGKSSISKKLLSSVPPRLQKHFKYSTPQANSNKKSNNNKRSWGMTWTNLRRMQDARKKESQKVRRMAIYDELVALQAVKRKAKQQEQQKTPKKQNNHNSNKDDREPLGYALVTGASRGIGRAIAGTKIYLPFFSD